MKRILGRVEIADRAPAHSQHQRPMAAHESRESILVPPAQESAEQLSIGFSIGGAHQPVELVQQLGMAYRHGPYLVSLGKLLY